jgi:hypothetical protein
MMSFNIPEMEKWPHHPKVIGSNLAITVSMGRKKMEKLEETSFNKWAGR